MRTPSSWEAVFMKIAFALAERSKDPSTQVGAVIVSPITHEIVGTGFNGPPYCIDDSKVPWDNRQAKYNWVLHAEANAIHFCRYRPIGCHLFVTGVPCRRCMLDIAQAGIKRVIYGDKTPHLCDIEEQMVVSTIAAAAEIELVKFS